MKRPFRSPFNIKIAGYYFPFSALLGVAGTFVIWCQVIVTKPYGRNLGFLWMGLGLLMYLLYRKKKKIAPGVQLTIEKIKLPKLKPLDIKKILLPITVDTKFETMQIACELAKFHKAALTMLHVIEVPAAVPFTAPLPHRVPIEKSLLQKAEAIARDLNVEADLQVVSSRAISESILQLIKEKKYDLLILGSKHGHHLGNVADKILKSAACRVWIYLN